MLYFTVGDVISKAPIEKCGDEEYPVLSMTMHDGIVFQNDRFKKQIASVDQSTYNIVRRKQLVVSFPIDEGVLAVQDITDAGIVSPAYKIWNIDESKIIPKFLEMFLRSPRSIQYYKSKLRGSTARRRSITDNDFVNMTIPQRTLVEQKRVIQIIQQVQSIITHRKQQLAKLDELVKARFVELFGDPATNPNGYPIKAMSEIAEYWNGLTYKPEDVSEKGTVVLRSSNIQNMQLDFADTVRVSCKIGDKKYVQDNDILMCSRNGSAKLVGKVALIHGIDEPMSFGAFMMIIRSQYSPYLMTYFQLPAFRSQITTGATTTINQITSNMMNKVMLPVPDMSMVNAFAAFVEQITKSKFVYAKK